MIFLNFCSMKEIKIYKLKHFKTLIEIGKFEENAIFIFQHSEKIIFKLPILTILHLKK
jgi:hypothetical protein